MLQVVHVVHSLNPGGAERLAADMAVGFSSRFRTAVVCLDEPGVWAANVRAAGVPVYSLYRQPGVDLLLARRLASFLRRNRVRLVHAHQVTPWFYSGLACLLGGRSKLLFEEHGRHYPEVENPKRAWFNRRVLEPLTARTVAVSEDVKDRLVRYEGLSAARIQVIHNGAPAPPEMSPAERASVRRAWGFGPRDFVVGTVGRFDPIKNLPMLLRALEMARRDVPSLKALLVGDGPEFPRIRDLVDALGLADVVRLAGYRADAARLTGGMDLFVLASFSEGTSMALLQSMAWGVPAAVTRVGGNPELVVDGVTGWLVGSDDARALAEVLVAASRNPEERRKRGLRARERFRAEFTFDRMMARYEALYRELIG